MNTIYARSVNEALGLGIQYLLQYGIEENSRNGKVLVSRGPVMTVYERPKERVLFNSKRDANPFFHLMEALWMLQGRDDVAFVAQFAKRMATFSDDGVRMHGAYGARWRHWFGFDQVAHILAELQRNPESRRCVLGMWSPNGDLVSLNLEMNKKMKVQVGGIASKDVPCNTQAYFDLRGDKLNMTVCNRSNDVIWGCYGANAVHFSMLQEYMARALNKEVGKYYQFSNNYHIYPDNGYTRDKLIDIADECRAFTDAMMDVYSPYPIMNVDLSLWHEDLNTFMKKPAGDHKYNDPFFADVARPMFMAWHVRKEKIGDGLVWADKIKAYDWQLAAIQWIERREEGKAQ